LVARLRIFDYEYLDVCRPGFNSIER